VGRPSKYTAEVADEICERLADGESLRMICQAEEMPNRATVFRWLASNAEFRDQYALAREAQADALADEILDIADESAGDVVIDADGNERTDQERVARSKLRVDARKWIASKLKPKVYGERIQQDITADMNITTDDDASAIAAAERLESRAAASTSGRTTH
jgi:hypothetical protein